VTQLELSVLDSQARLHSLLDLDGDTMNRHSFNRTQTCHVS
jgi:hypothetical protein